ncbi:MCE family protein [Sulfurimonas sp. SAG-AH-194-C20]|nr:MCE family protein [Sulfurimonas sp. SAG-AH-194-C20]
MLAFTYWLMKTEAPNDVKKYTIYFDESVLGLNIDAPVKYRGISVGKVKVLRINPRNSEQVQVTVSVLKTTPIKTTTVAKLTAQGITGLTYINLSMGKHTAKVLKAKENENYPVIKTVPSFFENFEKSLGSVSTRLSSTLGLTEELLGSDNQEQMASLLKRSASVMNKMDLLLDEKTITHIQSSAKNIDEFSQKLNKMMPNIDRFLEKSVKWEDETANSFTSITTSYLGITASMDEIKRAIASGEFNIQDISADLIPTMNNTFLQMQELMIGFEGALEQYNSSPSDILYKKETIKKAPGEK